MVNGIIIIDKPSDWTSHDVVAKLRGKLGEKRVGHAGTLDPMATGVLPVFLGRATRAVEFAAEGEKEYVAGLRLGVVTDTQDMTGTVLEQHPVSATQGEVEAVLDRFRGPILQVPPMFSALKRDGKKLYELARRGVEVEREPRPITIHALELTGTGAAPAEFILRVRCSKGTYIRTLCHDIGAALGCGGVMASLRRTMACGFSLSDALALDRVLTAEDAQSLLRPVDSYFARYPALTVDSWQLFRAKNGNPFPCEAPDGDYRVYGPGEEFLLLGRCAGGEMTTIKSFYEV
jgi:tRNA pseudouridine55 synthase